MARLLQVGNFTALDESGVCFNSEAHWKRSFESLGHEVIAVQESTTTAEELVRIARAANPRLFFHTRTWGIRGDVPAMLAALEAMRIPSVTYHLDLFAPITRGVEVRDHFWWRSKYCFTPDGGSDAFWAKHGINHFYMPPGVLEADCYLADPDLSMAVEVLFVGSYGYHHEWPYRPKLIDWLAATYGDRFKLIPEGQPGGPRPGGGHRPAVRGHRLNILYASAKVVVGDTLCVGFTHPYYTSDRLFETTGRGGFLVYPRIKGITDGTLVTEGEHIAAYTYGDFDGLKRTIDYYLEHEDEREKIRRAGQAHVRAAHTYKHRLAEMLRIVGEREGWK